MLEGTSGGFYSSLPDQSVDSSEVRVGCLRVDLVELGKPQRMETAQTLWAPECLSAVMAEQVSP